jgi:hypothetical protein
MPRDSNRAEELEAELERRLQELGHREAALKKIADTVLKQRPAAPAPAPEPRARFGRRRPDGRVRELEAEVESLRARIAELEQAPPEPPAPREEEPLEVIGRPTLRELEELAAEAARRNRPEAEEWAVYVGLLREHAWPDGTIPPHFDDLLRDVFGASF